MPNHTKPKKINTKWTKPLARKEAKKYTGKGAKSAFQKGSSGAYNYVLRNKLMETVCAHMVTLRTTWTLVLLKKEAKKYQTRGAFQNGSIGAYRYAHRHKLLNSVCAHMKVRKIDILKGIRNAVRGMKRKRATK